MFWFFGLESCGIIAPRHPWHWRLRQSLNHCISREVPGFLIENWMPSKLLEVQVEWSSGDCLCYHRCENHSILLWCRCQESAAAKASSTTATAAETSHSKAGNWALELGVCPPLSVIERWPLPLFHLLNVIWEHLTDSIQISWGSLATRKFRKNSF